MQWFLIESFTGKCCCRSYLRPRGP